MGTAAVDGPPGPSLEETSALLPSREVWPAVLVALVVGLALILWIFHRHRAPPATAASADSQQRRLERLRGFVRARLDASALVLFVADAGAAAAPFVALFDALDMALDVVDLSCIAGGRQILAELRTWEHDEGRAVQEQQQAFLFIDGKLLGDFGRVRRLLLAQELEAAVPEGKWQRVRLDPRSTRGFDVRSPANAFQSLSRVAAEQDPSRRLETKPLATLAELRDADLASLARCFVPLAPRSRDQARRSKLLVCHDMKGGYLDDRFRQVRSASGS